LFGHAIIHATTVQIITGSWFLFLLELVVHLRPTTPSAEAVSATTPIHTSILPASSPTLWFRSTRQQGSVAHAPRPYGESDLQRFLRHNVMLSCSSEAPGAAGNGHTRKALRQAASATTHTTELLKKP
jgi:hypothetical protein